MNKDTYRVITSAYRGAFNPDNFDYSYTTDDAFERFNDTVCSDLGVSQDDADHLIRNVKLTHKSDRLCKPMDFIEGKFMLALHKRGIDISRFDIFIECARVRCLVKALSDKSL